jgi:signal peptidase I
MGTVGDYFYLESVNPGDRVQFTSDVPDSDVYHWVEDRLYNHILTDRLGNTVSEGVGSFIAADSGPYLLHFSPVGLITPSVLIIRYKVHPAEA